jgi:serine/threonine protein kinase
MKFCPVTLKVISEKYIGDESARLCLLREARAAVSVRHTNVASVFRLGRTGDDYFYAMEFVEVETLEKLIKRSGRHKVKLAIEIATQVAVEGVPWSRHGDLVKAEAVRQLIVEDWSNYYEQRAARLEQTAETPA